MTTPKFTIVEVYAKLDASTPSGPNIRTQHTRLMCVETGRFFAVLTTPHSTGWSSEFVWCWPRVNGLANTWLLGDSISGKDGKPWIRIDSNTTTCAGCIPNAHFDAVKHITSLAANGYVDWDKAAYSGRPIPNLFHDPIVTPHNYAKVPPSKPVQIQRQPSSTPIPYNANQFDTAMDEVARLAKEMGITTVMPTQKDINAITKMAPNQSHDLTKRWYGVNA